MLLRLVFVLVASFALAGAARAEWREARSRHFVIYSDGSLDELRDFATKVETFDSAVRVVRKMADPPLGDHGRVTIYVLKNAGAVARMYGDSRSNVAGFYSPRASGSVAFVHRETDDGVPEEYRQFMLSADAVFFHEYFHHMMLSDTQAALPRWVIEGFAEFFSTATIEKDGAMMFGRAANHRSSGLFSRPDVTLEQIVGDSFGTLDDDGINELYARSWLLTHYLYSAVGRRGQLDRYLAGIQAGKPAIESAREAFGDLKQLDRELEHYLNSANLVGYRLPASRIDAGAIALRTMTEAKAEMMPVRMRSDRGVDEKAAAELVKEARAIGARYPRDAFVQGALAEAEYDAGDLAAAIAAADRALAVDPNNVQALIYKGRALMAEGKADPKAADWHKVRSWFARANRLEPEYAEPLMLYYQSYGAEGVQAPETAIKGLLYAVLLAPGDEGLRMSAVVELIQRNRLPEAKAAFVPIAYNPHLGAQWRDRFAKVMEAISAGKGSEAIALIQAPPPETKPAKKKA
jgi:tetratricopeptide (TPR) repeat protein